MTADGRNASRLKTPVRVVGINPTATCVSLSVSENSAGNPSEFGKELPFATKHSVFSIAESREGSRPAHRNLAFHLHYLSVSVVLKNTDI